jgi:hypothetical protein
MKRKITLLIAASAISAIALVAAGRGESAGRSPYSSVGYGSPVVAPAATRVAAAEVGVATTPLGRVIVDSKGRTLYLFEKDTDHGSACDGKCATYWPPLLTHQTRGEGFVEFGAGWDVPSPAGKEIESDDG